MTNAVPLEGGMWKPGPGGVLRWEPEVKAKSIGNKRKPLTLTPEEIRRGYSQYRQGFRTEFTVQANREYQRLWRRKRRMAHLAKPAERSPGKS